MDDIIKIVESLEKSVLLIGCATETVKHEKQQKGGFLVGYDCNDGCSLIVPTAY